MKDMLGRNSIIPADEALNRLLSALSGISTGTVRVDISDALGMVSAADIESAEDLPIFARSTVDGYAVSANDTYGATETMPAYLKLDREIFMGENSEFLLSKGAASKIPTGGMLPGSADAVVMFEHVQVADSSLIEILKPVAAGENVIQAGEDIKKGDVVLRRGSRIRPPHISALAGIGITHIDVKKRPVVSIISTGDEIIPAGAPLAPGRIRDTNSYMIAAMVEESGGMPRRMGIFPDDYNAIRSAIEEAMQSSDAIAVSGGTSVGTKDMIEKIILDVGNPGLIFHGVSLKPGKPMIGGVMNGIPIFGLPGHPAAVAICVDLFIRPVLELLSGCRSTVAARLKGTLQARLARNISSSQGREEHVRVILEEREGCLWAVPLLGKSGLIRTLVDADGIIKIPLNLNGIEKGEVVEVRLL